MKKIILCDLDKAENGYNYRCSRIDSNERNEQEDLCQGCPHKCYKEVDVAKTIYQMAKEHYPGRSEDKNPNMKYVQRFAYIAGARGVLGLITAILDQYEKEGRTVFVWSAVKEKIKELMDN